MGQGDQLNNDKSKINFWSWAHCRVYRYRNTMYTRNLHNVINQYCLNKNKQIQKIQQDNYPSSPSGMFFSTLLVESRWAPLLEPFERQKVKLTNKQKVGRQKRIRRQGDRRPFTKRLLPLPGTQVLCLWWDYRSRVSGATTHCKSIQNWREMYIWNEK